MEAILKRHFRVSDEVLRLFIPSEQWHVYISSLTG